MSTMTRTRKMVAGGVAVLGFVVGVAASGPALAATVHPGHYVLCKRMDGFTTDMKSKPKTCNLFGRYPRDLVMLRKMRWSKWGATAVGHGRLIPNHGPGTAIKVRVKLAHPTTCQGWRIYRDGWLYIGSKRVDISRQIPNCVDSD